MKDYKFKSIAVKGDQRERYDKLIKQLDLQDYAVHIQFQKLLDVVEEKLTVDAETAQKEVPA